MANLLRSRSAGARKLRQLLDGAQPVLAPGAFDAFSARLIESIGFSVVYMTGFGTAASRLGRPDVGLLTMTEMVDNAARIVDAVDVPVIADADTGYGNAINVVRTVQQYEQAGVAAIHLEDQVWPKKCGHMEGKQVIGADEMAEKIRAAKAAQTSEDFVVIARTDSRAVMGFDAALERARQYEAAGADLLFIEALETVAEVEAAASAFSHAQLVFNWAEGGKTPPLDLDQLAQLGFKLVIYPLSVLLTYMSAARQALNNLYEHGAPLGYLEDLPSFKEILDFIGAPELQALERQFSGSAHLSGKN
jgi:2,3-dimethylmalate lyase